MEFSAFIDNLNLIFKEDLPGFKSQIKAAPKSRKNLENYSSISNAKKSAVLILLYPKSGSIYIPFIKRVVDGSMHSGQIAFPGGKYEDSDKHLKYTALREAEEEVGIKKDDILILKELTPLYIPVSNYFVQPIVGMIDYSPSFKINKDEVDSLYNIDLNELYNSYTIIKELNIREVKINAPFYILKQIEIWGATAMILSEFLDILKKVDYN